jgi:hypothetical protein
VKAENPLRSRPQMGPKIYAVVIEHPLPGGKICQRPLKPDGSLGAFPDGGTRYQAKKLLRKARRTWPGAVLWMHREM